MRDLLVEAFNSKDSISSQELLKRLIAHDDKFMVLLDVREPDEFKDWRIEGSVNVPTSKLGDPHVLKSLKRGFEFVTICAHGIGSQQVAQLLRNLGFNAKHLVGGLASWSKVYDITKVPLPGEEWGATVLQLKRMGKGCASYIVSYRGECAVIDPSINISELLSIARGYGLTIKHVMDTHQHADHISGARALAKEVGAKLYLNPLDGYLFSGFLPILHGLRVELGDGKVSIEAIHTPGHTKGSTSFLIQGKAIATGDTLFLEGIARPDLHNKAEEYAMGLQTTYAERFLSLPGGLIVLPGHFSSFERSDIGRPVFSTLGEIRKRIPLLSSSREDFVSHVMRTIPPRPPNYSAILAINRGERSYKPGKSDELEEGPNRCVVTSRVVT